MRRNPTSAERNSDSANSAAQLFLASDGKSLTVKGIKPDSPGGREKAGSKTKSLPAHGMFHVPSGFKTLAFSSQNSQKEVCFKHKCFIKNLNIPIVCLLFSSCRFLTIAGTSMFNGKRAGRSWTRRSIRENEGWVKAGDQNNLELQPAEWRRALCQQQWRRRFRLRANKRGPRLQTAEVSAKRPREALKTNASAFYSKLKERFFFSFSPSFWSTARGLLMSHTHRKPDKDGRGSSMRRHLHTHSDAKSLPKKYIPFKSLSFLFLFWICMKVPLASSHTPTGRWEPQHNRRRISGVHGPPEVFWRY